MVLAKEIAHQQPDALPLDQATPEVTETATFSLGCFWSPEAKFGSIPGVIRTRVGYAGGTQENPTYSNLGDHIETVQMDYDPQQISYAELLDLFWHNHNPEQASFKRQYQSAAFYANEEQKHLLEQTKNRETQQRGQIETEIAPMERFYLAEDYHQKFRLRQHEDLMQEFDAIYDPIELINSTVAARVNSYLAGHGSLETFEAEVEQFGLSSEAGEQIRDILTSRQE
jgi:methionine-S-sulfoxide reductase